MILPRLGFENTAFRLLYGEDIQQLCLHSLDEIPLDPIWQPAAPARTLALAHGRLAPGEHHLHLEWHSPRGRHKQRLTFEVRAGYLVNPGPVVDFAVDQEQLYLARSSDITNQWLVGEQPITSLMLSDGGSILMVVSGLRQCHAYQLSRSHFA